jgi:dTDP-4-dehydrorhamnose 3,5-epimerase
MIEGVLVLPLRKIPDERGLVMHMLRCDAPHFECFGEIYFSVVYPGVIKGWHLHRQMTLNYAVVAGMIKLALYDDREESPSRGQIQELFLGDHNYQLVRIPPRVWNGVKNIGPGPATIANCATLPHDPEEMERLDPSSTRIPYDWSLKQR